MKLTVKGVAFYASLIVFSLCFLTPVILIVLTALKSPQDLLTNPTYAMPAKIMWSNFADAWTKGQLGVYMKNSAFISLIKVPLGIFIASMVAFALTRLDLKGSDGLFIFFLVGMMIPVQVALVPLNVGLTKLGLINTYTGIIIIYLGFGLSFCILVLRGFFRTIPRELDDAARIDGCSTFGVFWRILLPLSLPAIASLFILDFLYTWNEFLLAQIFLTDDSMRTVPTGLMNFKGRFSTDYTLMSAGVLMSVIPILVVYLLFQKYFVSGLGGSVKG